MIKQTTDRVKSVFLERKIRRDIRRLLDSLPQSTPFPLETLERLEQANRDLQRLERVLGVNQDD